MNNLVSLYGVIGNPVEHSLSPYMHNLGFQWENIKGCYHAFKVTDVEKAVHGVRGLGIKGLSVTIPHKETIIQHLDEISKDAASIGAVNTVINRDGYLYGENTDWIGVLKSLREHISVKGRNVLVIGAGGAAKGVCHAVNHDEGKLFITNRTKEKGEALANEFGGRFAKTDDAYLLDPEIIINTTSVGMYPETDRTPIEISRLRSAKLVLDIVYNPVETKLLREAKLSGIKSVSGIGMFVYQGEAQFNLWTGKSFDTGKMKEKIFYILKK